ncbi:MAG: class II fructose-bisphosphate aldolase [Patescibacteria group bacterium]|nr:class II fructose-bisphosphate aldolase [Patescibacteria group bacterium]MDE2172331.1 class II fructose-bisphosphate aldolase [Patescibacteria group bacterium]
MNTHSFSFTPLMYSLNLRDYVSHALTGRKAIGHFNVSTLDGIYAVADAAKELAATTVIIGVSEGERDYVGVRQAAAIVKSLREERGQAIFLNADHTYSFERVKEAIDAGYDSVIFDGAKLSFEDNVREAKKCVAYAREYSQRTGRDVIIEGELGFIGQSSKILDAIPEGAVVGEAMMTKPEDAARFVGETGIDMLAPAVGNIHGVVRGGDPALNIERVRQISQAVKIPLVLHGASGNSAADIEATVKNGVAIVHVNTELRIAYRAGLVKSLQENSDEVAPYKYFKPAKLAMQKVVAEKIKIICGLSS